jgi:hypothetical protein
MAGFYSAVDIYENRKQVPVIAGNVGGREGTFSPKIAAMRKFALSVSRKSPISRFGTRTMMWLAQSF